MTTQKTVEFTLPGHPEAQPCPGFKGGRRYNKKKALMLQKRADIAALLEGNHDGPIFTKEWLIVELELYFNRPRHHMKQRFGLQYLPERVQNSFEFLSPRSS